jgi:TRAP-type uncharacterized transport system substrate-binding protein
MGGNFMKKLFTMLAASAAVLVATGASADTFVRMVSGPSGGSWYPLGAKIMQVMQDEIPGIATSNTSGGGISNIKTVGMPKSGFPMVTQQQTDTMQRVSLTKSKKILDTLRLSIHQCSR